ncbi:MAG: hypothetical protein ACT4O1_04970 [Gemmatimonadota bacterium]
MGSINDDGVLRAKYHDWCSAQIAERFLALSPDEIYQLAERATGSAETAGPLPPLSSATVARVTEVLADEMELPTFEEWAAAYSEAPDEFDSEMLGFWKDA